MPSALLYHVALLKLLRAGCYSVLSLLFSEKMASRFNVSGVLDLLEDDDFGLSGGDDSDFEGDGICGYLPEVDTGLFEEDGENEVCDEEEGALDSPESHLGLQGGSVYY